MNTRRFAIFALAGMSTLGLAACGGGGASSAAYCDKAKIVSDFDDRMDNVDPTNMKGMVAEFEKLNTEMKEVADVAPDGIKPEWERMSAVVGDIATTFTPLKDLDLSDPASIDPKLLEDLNGLGTKMEGLDKEMTEVGDKIDTFTEKECGFKLGDS
jgi:ABC-type glycerol-3-phosphate transport system substrate-binding protein